MLKKSNQKGFTIIEVLIVLAIAGLIMLIVFLAVPALQRNSRNTQRKNDVAALQGAVQEYVNNNGGNMPTTAAQVTNLAKLTYYAAGDVSLAAATADVSNAKNTAKVAIYTKAKCGDVSVTAASGTTTTTSGSAVFGASRSAAILYSVEGSGTNASPQCVES